jgi:hypothetical protein
MASITAFTAHRDGSNPQGDLRKVMPTMADGDHDSQSPVSGIVSFEHPYVLGGYIVLT